MLPVEYDAKAIKRLVDKTNNVFASGNATLTKSIVDLSTTSSEGDATNAASIVTEATVRSDGDSALSSLITALSATSSEGDATNAASIVTEATARSDGDSALATTITALAASTSAADIANAASVVAAATAASSATGSLTNVVNAQRSLFGAAVSDTWDATKQYIGSTETIDSVDVATGEEAVKGGLVYRCRATHTNQQPPSTSYWDLVDTVAAVVSASVLIESNTRASADVAQAQTSNAISGRVTTLEDDTTDADAAAVNAADIVTTNSLIVTNDSAYSERFELTAARFGITVTDTYDNARTYQIGEEAIYLSNLYRCTAISLGNIPTDTLFWAFQALVPADISAAVLTETNARVSADAALAQDITTVTATAAGNSAQIIIEATASAAADSLLQIDLNGAIADAATAQAAADGKIDSFYQNAAPVTASEGDIWFDTNDGNTIYTYQSGVWTLSADSDIALAILDAASAQATADGKVTSFYATTAPTAEGVGDFWVDTDDGNKLYRWSGTAWVDVRDTGIAGAIAEAASAQAAADGKIETFFTTTAPTASGVGDLWFDTDDGNTIYRWSGTAWVLSADSDIALAILDAAGAQATADGKVTTFYQATAPTAEGEGDLWVDIDDGNKLYRWDLSTWVNIDNAGIVSAIADAATAQAAADGKIDSFYQATAPAVASEGDIWFDTDDGNKIYTYRSSVWTVTVDTDIALSIGAAAGAQATADGKVTTFYQATAPTAEGSGDLWVDTDDGNKLYRWNLSAWVLVQDTAIPSLEARYGVDLDVNGYITGFSQNNDGTSGQFKIIADDFRIIDPADAAGEAGAQVFSVIGGIVTMDTAHIGNLTIGTGKITDNAISISSFAKHTVQTGSGNKTFSTTVSMPNDGTITVICKAGVYGSGSSAQVVIQLSIDGVQQDSIAAQGGPALGNHTLLGAKDVTAGNRVVSAAYSNIAYTNNPSQKADFIILRTFK